MKIETEVKRRIFDINGKEVKVGDSVLIQADHDYVGIYAGITTHGALRFKSMVDESYLNLLPRTIKQIIPVEVILKMKEK